MLHGPLVGGPALDHHVDPPPFEGPPHLFQPLDHERVMAFVRLRIRVGDPEKDQEGLPKLVGGHRGIFQGVVLLRPLGGLHPVQDVLPLPGRRLVQDLDPPFPVHPVPVRHRSPVPQEEAVPNERSRERRRNSKIPLSCRAVTRAFATLPRGPRGRA